MLHKAGQKAGYLNNHILQQTYTADFFTYLTSCSCLAPAAISRRNSCF